MWTLVRADETGDGIPCHYSPLQSRRFLNFNWYFTCAFEIFGGKSQKLR